MSAGFASNMSLVLRNNRTLQKNLRKNLLLKKKNAISNKIVPITDESILQTLKSENDKYIKRKLKPKRFTMIKQRLFILLTLIIIFLVCYYKMN